MDLLRELGPQVAGIVAVVILFLRYLGKRDCLLKTIGEECHAVQRQTTQALIDNAEASGRHIEAFAKHTEALTEAVERLRAMNGKN